MVCRFNQFFRNWMHAWVAIRFLLDIPIVLRFWPGTQNQRQTAEGYFILEPDSGADVNGIMVVIFTCFRKMWYFFPFLLLLLFVSMLCVALSDFYRISKALENSANDNGVLWDSHLPVARIFNKYCRHTRIQFTPLDGWSHFRWVKFD